MKRQCADASPSLALACRAGRRGPSERRKRPIWHSRVRELCLGGAWWEVGVWRLSRGLRVDVEGQQVGVEAGFGVGDAQGPKDGRREGGDARPQPDGAVGHGDFDGTQLLDAGEGSAGGVAEASCEQAQQEEREDAEPDMPEPPVPRETLANHMDQFPDSAPRPAEAPAPRANAPGLVPVAAGPPSYHQKHTAGRPAVPKQNPLTRSAAVRRVEPEVTARRAQGRRPDGGNTLASAWIRGE